MRSGGLGRRVLHWYGFGHRGPRSQQEEPVKTHHRKEAIGEEMQTGRRRFCSLLRLWIWTQLIAVPFYLSLSRIGEADNPGPAHATAKLFGEQFEAIVQWATNLTSKREMESTPLLAQVGRMQTKCSASVLRKSPILADHRSVRTSRALSRMDRFHLPVSPEPEGDFAHTQQFSDYLSLFQVGDECDESRHVLAQMQIG